MPNQNYPNSTGCDILDKAGVTIGEKDKRPDLCLNCPYPECIIVTNEDDLVWKHELPLIREVYLVCKTCGASETVTMTDGKLQKTQRWLQRGDVIYHMINCGIAEVRGG